MNIISINKVATPDDIKRKFFRKRTFMTETFVIVSCTDSVKRELESQNLSYLQTIDYKGLLIIYARQYISVAMIMHAHNMMQVMQLSTVKMLTVS